MKLPEVGQKFTHPQYGEVCIKGFILNTWSNNSGYLIQLSEDHPFKSIPLNLEASTEQVLGWLADDQTSTLEARVKELERKIQEMSLEAKQISEDMEMESTFNIEVRGAVQLPSSISMDQFRKKVFEFFEESGYSFAGLFEVY